MRIENGLVYTPQFSFEKKTVVIRNGLFGNVYADDAADDIVLDASGCFVIPGLVDIHFHGCMGSDFCDGTTEAIRTIAEFEAKEGVTAICPATLTLPVEELEDILSCAAGYVQGYLTAEEEECTATGRESKYKRAGEADLVGINMEGPFISHVKKGAQNERYIISCDADIARSFVEASDGLVKIIGLAPEENPDFREYISKVREMARVSLAHTNADYDTAMAAFEAGASHAVHLFNAMPEMTHRQPGVVGAVRDSGNVTAELICDGNHVHPSVVRAAFDMLGEARIVLISDSLRACGLGDGRMMLGGQEVIVSGTKAVLAEGGALAGSVCSLMRCLQIVVKEMHIPLEKAVRCAALNPARVIGADGMYGSIEEGKKGNAVLLDKETLQVRAVIKDGMQIR